MTDIIATFRLKDSTPDGEIINDEIDDMLRELAEKSDMDLISWGTI